ncbi:hypothetical protein [Rhizobium rhizosphaerae]|uniref:hypothetical protein n=1 Tax=Xaviernesmea rhizosphaerae TaxID=1672749 RepID=UPI00117A8F2E|nr:hypothetical protein [Xaviernesmea rhizosphaerae]
MPDQQKTREIDDFAGFSFCGRKSPVATFLPFLPPDRAPDGRCDQDGKDIEIECESDCHGLSFPRTRLAAKSRIKAVKSQVIVDKAIGREKAEIMICPLASETTGEMKPAATQAVDSRSIAAAVSFTRSLCTSGGGAGIGSGAVSSCIRPEPRRGIP